MPKRKRMEDWDDAFRMFDVELGGLRERMDRILEQMLSGELTEIEDPIAYGFSMRIWPDGAPSIQQFGNAAPPQPSDLEPPAREPLTDIREDKDKVTVIMELPGVDKRDIKVTAEDRDLELEVDSPDKRYSKHLDLPCDVLPASAKANYKNGVLEVVIRRAAPKRKRKTVKVD